MFNITFCSHISVLLYDVSFFASLKKALGFPRHKYCSNIRPGQMKPHFCEAFFVNTFRTIVIIVLIIEILRQSPALVSPSHVLAPPRPPPWLERGVTFYKFVISRVHFLRYGLRLQKVAGTFKSKINCFSIQIIVFCVRRGRNTNMPGPGHREHWPLIGRE